MSSAIEPRTATLADLARHDGKAELIAGRIVPLMPTGRLPGDEDDFIAGPPTFAVEVPSKSDHGSAADRELAAKRADYFEAGTLVVWDVDPRERTILSYRADAPDQPIPWTIGQLADAEPAVPGWQVAVGDSLGFSGARA